MEENVLDIIDSEQHTDDENVDISLSKRKIYTIQGDPEIDSLYKKRKRGKLVLQPDYQRRFVWDIQKSSKLMESVLLDLPLPMIYLSEEKDGKEYVIDGQQRLTSFFSFIDGNLPDGRSFKLTGLDVFPEYNGKSFSDLNEDIQEKIMYCKIRTVIFSEDTDEDLKFEIFKKLNTGVVVLNDQELRNCIYNGEYSKLLKQLSEDEDFMYLLGLTESHPRMKDVELVLRFAAFYHYTYLKYKSPMKKFYNDDMREFRCISDIEKAELIAGFKNAVSIIKSMFGNHAFKRFYEGSDTNRNGNWEPKKFNASLFDILMYSFAKEDKNKVYQNLDVIREALIHLMTTDKKFIGAIELSTSSVQAVTSRFDKWRLTLQEIIGINQKEPRCFSLKLKQELYNNDPTCSICNQKIQNIDDAAIDHIEQYWTGGRTIPENARLVHRYCNSARPRSRVYNEQVLQRTNDTPKIPMNMDKSPGEIEQTLSQDKRDNYTERSIIIRDIEIPSNNVNKEQNPLVTTGTMSSTKINLQVVPIDEEIKQSNIKDRSANIPLFTDSGYVDAYYNTEKILNKLVNGASKIGSTSKEMSYMLTNGVAIMLDYSKWYAEHCVCWHGVDKSKCEKYADNYDKFYVVLKCQFLGIFPIPGDTFIKLFKNFRISDNSWKFKVIPEGKCILIKELNIDISEYRNIIGILEDKEKLPDTKLSNIEKHDFSPVKKDIDNEYNDGDDDDEGKYHPCTWKPPKMCIDGEHCITRFKKGECYNEKHTGKRLKSFSFMGKVYQEAEWKWMTVKLSEIMSVYRRDSFNRLNIRGTQNRNFVSNNQEGMVSSKKIKDTDIYVNTNMDADYHVGLCRAILEGCGYDYKKDFQIHIS